VHSPECYVTLREGQDLADSGAPAAAFTAAELEGAHWYNAVKAKKRGKNIKCAGCGKLGATVGCYTAACKKSYHYPCAVATGWEFGDVPDSHGKVFR
jgi:PHD-like zinc-binding domain